MTSGAIDLPEFYQPRPARLSPYLARVRAHTRAWAARMGMLGPGSGWSREYFDSVDIGLLAALTHPDAPPEALELTAGWYVWAYYADDHAMAGGAVERGLADLLARTAPAIRPGMRELLARFRHTPSWTGGVELVAYLAGQELPADLRQAEPVRRLTDAFIYIGPLRNDIFSYQKDSCQKEMRAEEEPRNGVLTIERFLGCSTSQAVTILRGLIDQRMEEFEDIATMELSTLDLNEPRRWALDRYVTSLRQWLAGHLEWSIETGRYASAPAYARAA